MINKACTTCNVHKLIGRIFEIKGLQSCRVSRCIISYLGCYQREGYSCNLAPLVASFKSSSRYVSNSFCPLNFSPQLSPRLDLLNNTTDVLAIKPESYPQDVTMMTQHLLRGPFWFHALHNPYSTFLASQHQNIIDSMQRYCVVCSRY
jgi:hypothetical protein